MHVVFPFPRRATCSAGEVIGTAANSGGVQVSKTILLRVQVCQFVVSELGEIRLILQRTTFSVTFLEPD